MSTSAKKEAILKQFRSITNATPQDAHRILKAHSYRLEPATNAFFSDTQAQLNAAAAAAASSSSSSSSRALDKKAEKELKDRLNALFDDFADEDDRDKITIDGALQMCEALQVSPEDVVFLPLSFYLKSPSIGTFTREDYVNGWKILDQSDDLEKQQRTLQRLRQELYDNKPIRLERAAEEKSNPNAKRLYERVYEYTYGFARREGQKSLALENAIAFWDLVLPASPTFQRDGSTGTFTRKQLEMWKKFLVDETGNRAVSKDTWTQFLDFTKEINHDFSNHDFDAAWPSVIDDFVVWAKENGPTFVLPDSADGMDTS
ncbi:DUF298-domain-containing protein [Testicularia cyperi]|uniref:Defective in cullin neddylation protein n=1 Tax=Testicularia cyperi TaxID=1882483 RepID=A0A317Y122_9BASI|nr:DUF298-domain-containing protein [Testicularia cyperi]